MNSYNKVMADFAGWTSLGWTKAQRVVALAEDTLGWPYVWGASGVACTPAKRQYYAGRDVCPDGEKKEIKRTCPVLNGSQSSCSGCKWFPGEEYVLIDDCQGWIKWLMRKIDIVLTGAGCTSMWNDNSLWTQKGEIKDLPEVVCCVFKQNQKDHKTMEHIGLYIGNGQIIHCSGTVKRGSTSERGWTHYAIPKGMDGGVPVSKPTLRKGSTGPYVVECQNDLIRLGYDLSPYGADGKYGTKTMNAVKSFQAKSGLIADGICGPLTWDALDAAVGPQPAVLYTVTVPHLTAEQADALIAQYPGSSKKEEPKA